MRTRAAVHSDMMGVALRSSEPELHMPLLYSSPDESEYASLLWRLRQLKIDRGGRMSSRLTFGKAASQFARSWMSI